LRIPDKLLQRGQETFNFTGELNNSVCDLVDEMKKLLMEVNVARLNINDVVKELKEISSVNATVFGYACENLDNIKQELKMIKMCSEKFLTLKLQGKW